MPWAKGSCLLNMSVGQHERVKGILQNAFDTALAALFDIRIVHVHQYASEPCIGRSLALDSIDHETSALGERQSLVFGM